MSLAKEANETILYTIKNIQLGGTIVTNKDVFENQLFSMTTILHAEYSTDSKHGIGASGFFYCDMTPTGPNTAGFHWERIDHWLITNRHVLFPKDATGNEVLIDKLVFYLRETIGGQVNWVPIELNQNQIINQTRLHNDLAVDVVAINVSKQISNKGIEMINSGKTELMIPATLTKYNLPDNQPITIDVTSDIVILCLLSEY